MDRVGKIMYITWVVANDKGHIQIQFIYTMGLCVCEQLFLFIRAYTKKKLEIHNG